MIGDVPLDFTEVSGFDIPSEVRTATSGAPVASGIAYAALTVAGEQRLYSIDLVSGAATDIGTPAGDFVRPGYRADRIEVSQNNPTAMKSPV